MSACLQPRKLEVLHNPAKSEKSRRKVLTINNWGGMADTGIGKALIGKGWLMVVAYSTFVVT